MLNSGTTMPTQRISRAKKGKRVHGCNYPGCEKIFTRAEHLRRHQLNHSTEVYYKCELCERTFVRQDLLTRHTERHATQARKAVQTLALTQRHRQFSSHFGISPPDYGPHSHSHYFGADAASSHPHPHHHHHHHPHPANAHSFAQRHHDDPNLSQILDPTASSQAATLAFAPPDLGSCLIMMNPSSRRDAPDAAFRHPRFLDYRRDLVRPG